MVSDVIGKEKVMGTLQQISPEPIHKAIEEAFLKKLYSKLFMSANMFVKGVRAIREKYGDEGVETMKVLGENMAWLLKELHG